MLLPGGDRAIVDSRKLRDYCLNPDNPRGSGKARVFAAALGLTAARTEEAELGELDMYGQRYTVDFKLETETWKAVVRSGWIILHNETAPRLTTCYVKKRKK